MRVVNRVLLAVAALLLGIGIVRPLWHIGLIAPQYPEGIGLYLWAGQITGQKPNDLQSINGLNHYIGMKPIVPESIPELRFMPAILGGLMALGLLAAAVGRRRGLFLWTGLLAVFALAGLADFWRWGYQYGHELDPTAAIKVPGLSYQPPLIGSKQLLNFFATSWPASGGWAVMISVVLALGLCFVEWRRSRRPKQAPVLKLAAAAAVVMLLAGCGKPGPVPIAYGTVDCTHCHMSVADPRYGAELVTIRNKVLVFDDPGCLALYLASDEIEEPEVHSLWVNDFLQPDSLLDVHDAVFVRSDSLRTPMDTRLAALRPGPAADSLIQALGGERLSWDQVQARANGHVHVRREE